MRTPLVHALLSETCLVCRKKVSLEMDRKFGSGSDLLYNLWKHPGVLVLKVKVKRWLVDALRPPPHPQRKPPENSISTISKSLTSDLLETESGWREQTKP